MLTPAPSDMSIGHKISTFSSFQRVRKRLDFQYAFRHGKRLYSALYVLYYCHNDLGYARVGAVVSKRNAKKAVQRNKIKRIVREVFRLQQAELGSLDIVLVARKQANEADKEALRKCLERLFKKLKRCL